ncbi:sodium:dicarboxylate symporter [Solidesulfovibrio carbinoliphilus subsp. oakridgensis]|uniref:Sodium:dicarboxylate symporter n=1 Tax=Solidesulfovibrio carbinoliphilus subsp. oakridgensis TaxID=694327 RepID=G7QBZ7_9BACT|nr:C4-dicarboxylate transporter DctA [Solidesulfovibrio carbinoliphilus]EHJ46032.1 sodium:dicarboxylate symporter [Solidesulfovibrio carbinoliphilus subsp. oakridgensis]
MSGHKAIYKTLYFWVITGIVLGIVIGLIPATKGFAESMQPFGTAFIRMVKMIIAPIIFCTVVTGIAKMGDMGKVGRVGLKCMLYFWTMTLFALAIGLVIVNLYKPGAGMDEYAAKLQNNQAEIAKVEAYAGKAKKMSTVDFMMNIIPTSVVDAFAKGEILQVLFFSILFGVALANLGDKAKNFVRIIDEFAKGLFRVVHYIMYFAPLGAFGAMAYVVASQGVEALYKLLFLMVGVYSTCLIFIFVVLAMVCRLAKFSLWRYLVYIKEEILLVLGTSSSEAALPRMMAKLENAGADKSVVGLCLPMGYSFNLDGTCIYLTMAAVFLAQATNTPLDLSHQLYLLFILLLTSKGAAAVTGGGFITLAATLQTLGTIPVASLTLLLGVDRFMSEARAITNLIGNGIATLVVAKWENALDEAKLARVLSGADDEYADDPEDMLILEESAETATVAVTSKS